MPSTFTVEEYKNRYQSLQSKIRYYTKLEKSKGQLTPKQQAKYTELTNQLNELESNRPDELPPKKKYNSYEEYLEANKERSRERYRRIKDNDEYKQYLKEYHKTHYVHKRKPKNVISSESSLSSSSE